MHKRLSELLHKSFDIDPIIMGISADSRAVRAGYLFAALSGAKIDGSKFIESAIENGAVAIVVQKGTAKPLNENLDWSNVVWIESENPRAVLSAVAAEYYHTQPETILAVTGTNGKTSTVTFVRQILQKMGFYAASLGTLGLQGVEISTKSASMTTPDPVQLHVQLAEMVELGVTHVAMEASSHGLHQHRLDGVKIFAGGFTNLTHDHLDYHKTKEDYLKAKARLFSEVIRDGGVAVLNADVPEYSELKRIAEERHLKVISYGRQAQDLKLIDLSPRATGTWVRLNLWGQEIELIIPLVGEFQIYNVLCAVGLVLARCPKRLQEVIDILHELNGVPGRLQLVNGLNDKAKPAVYVDYAHTPDALENILKSLRPHVDGKMICVFGCGGDRDKTKRPIMGKIATDMADEVIVTDDNPRTENADDIRKEILVGALNAIEIGNRHDAIKYAIQNATKNDLVVIAGKGHEQGQIIGDVIEPFDDVTEAKNILATL